MATRLRAVLALAATLVWFASCDQDGADHTGPVYPAWAVTGVAPAAWMPGTRVRVAAEGLLPAALAGYTLVLDGAIDSREATITLPLERVGAELVAIVGAETFALVDGDVGGFSGRAIVHRTIRAPDGGEVSKEIRVDVSLHHKLVPALDAVGDTTAVYPGDHVPISVAGLLLAGEGDSALVLSGWITYPSGEVEEVAGRSVPVVVDAAPRRDAARAVLSPGALGVRPGVFAGEARLATGYTAGLAMELSPPVPVTLAVVRPELTALTPGVVTRGQWLTAGGHGLLGLDGFGTTATLLVFEGVFTPRRGSAEVRSGAAAWVLPVEEVDGNTAARAALRTRVGADGGLEGLGARAGRFAGTVTARLVAGADAVTTAPLPVTLDVAPPRQQVELRLLPGFDDALALFGLAAERDAVLARILAVLERDYAGLNIGFAYAAPPGVAEHAVVELTGPDPNGSHLFGLDNTAGKDVGNLRLDDVVGGFNAETRAGNHAAYGGVFVAELLTLSPSLGTNALASSRFDDVFMEVVPALGGIPAAPGEAARADARGAAIGEAVRVLGNLVGSTITHEVGHTLGLTALAGRAHNEGDNPGWIMDLGIYRPFEERAELDGAGPAVFSPFNQAYLAAILPLDPQE